MPGAGQGTAMLNVQEIGARRAADRRTRAAKCALDRRLERAAQGEDSGCAPGRTCSARRPTATSSSPTRRFPQARHLRYEGEFQIADLDSSNGTFVNDEKVQKHDLIDNDIIKLGTSSSSSSAAPCARSASKDDREDASLDKLRGALAPAAALAAGAQLSIQQVEGRRRSGRTRARTST